MPIEYIEDLLAETGRKCLRVIVTRRLTHEQSASLAKWLFGCMNQRFTIRSRVEKRGTAEIDKVLEFVAQAAAAIEEIEGVEDE
ncbi:MAG: hypothetical protein ACREHD_01075 [Pirellulales bacterium]